MGRPSREAPWGLLPEPYATAGAGLAAGGCPTMPAHLTIKAYGQ